MTARYEIGIVETRNVIKTILDTYNYDFRDYALTSFKRRVEEVITNNGLRDADGLIYRLQSSKDYFDVFLKEITPETTEMFRDPSLWRAMRDDILPELKRSSSKPKIWIANFDSGEELYSLCILLKEYGLLEGVQIYVSIISETTRKKIISCKIDPKQVEVNEANYQRTNAISVFSKYFTTNANGIFFDNSLIAEVNFIKQDTLFSNPPGGVKLTLFRNQIIYFNQTQQDKVLNTVSESIVAGGHLILGAKETLENTNINHKFTVVNDSDKIYRKKTG